MSEPDPGGGRGGQLASSGLRPGWTTGACATAAARAAFVALRTGAVLDTVTVRLPRGHTPTFALTDLARGVCDGRAWAMAAVTKDAGDDPDITHGAVVRVVVRERPPDGLGVRFVAGPGVGTVTLPGLPLPVGEPAINPMPRRMILDNLASAAQELPTVEAAHPHGAPDLDLEVGIDHGAELALRTLNPRLGIIGGLSVLGTTGVVVPYSCSAWIDSIRRGVDVAVATGQPHVAGCTGSTSERAAAELLGLPPVALLDMGDFVGAVLGQLRRNPVPRLTVCGGFAKLSKLAAGHLDLHSARSSVDTAHLAGLVVSAHAPIPDASRPPLATPGSTEQAGQPADVAALAQADVGAIANAPTALAALSAARERGIELGDLVAAAARDAALAALRGAPVVVDVICLDREGRPVGRCRPAGPGSRQ